MKIITWEEHIVDKDLTGASRDAILEISPYYANSLNPDLPYWPDFKVYADTAELRLADMDENGIDMQVLSCPAESGLLDGKVALPLAQAANEVLAKAVRAHPNRFRALATLPWQDPEASASELARAVKQLGMSGAMLAGRPARGAVFLDDARFEPVLAAAEELGVPIYVHPGTPHPDVQATYYARLDPVVEARVSVFGWGWHNEAGIQVLRMMLSGAFDRHPKLQIISGHWGEFVPYYLARLDQALPQECTGLSRTLTQTYAEQVYVTPSGIFTDEHIHFIRETIGVERILFSVDFPLVPNEGARAFLEGADVTPAERELIAHGNSERLLGLA